MVAAEAIVQVLGGAQVIGPKGSRETLGERLRERVREGLPYASVEAVASRFGIGREDLVAVLRLPARTLARRKREKRLRADESDRLLRVGRIAALAEEVLGDRKRAARWLHEPNRALGGAVPLRHLDTDLGARQVEDVLLRIAHGVSS